MEEINERLKARVKSTKTRVVIATVHEYKGKEADSVYIWNDSEGIYPYKDSMDSPEELEEERRVHYIACTRARQKSTIMYLKGQEGMFVTELDLSKATEMRGETSGSMRKNLETKMREEAGLKMFEQSAVVDSEGVIL